MSETATQHLDPHEQRDVSPRGLLVFALIFGAIIVVAVTILWYAFGTREGGFAAAQHLGRVADDNELQQRDQLARYLTAQQAELERLEWTDANRQTAKVPIEDAMALLAGRRASP
jgi:hypothetical protein